MKVAQKPVKALVFTFEWSLIIEENMSINLEDVMDKMREMGSCDMMNVEIREVQP